MPRKKLKPQRCPHCSRTVKSRGVCAVCYQTGRNRIARSETTDEQLVQLGWWKPAGRKGGAGESAKALDRLLATKAG